MKMNFDVEECLYVLQVKAQEFISTIFYLIFYKLIFLEVEKTEIQKEAEKKSGKVRDMMGKCVKMKPS